MYDNREKKYKEQFVLYPIFNVLAAQDEDALEALRRLSGLKPAHLVESKPFFPTRFANQRTVRHL